MARAQETIYNHSSYAQHSFLLAPSPPCANIHSPPRGLPGNLLPCPPRPPPTRSAATGLTGPTHTASNNYYAVLDSSCTEHYLTTEVQVAAQQPASPPIIIALPEISPHLKPYNRAAYSCSHVTTGVLSSTRHPPPEAKVVDLTWATV